MTIRKLLFFLISFLLFSCDGDTYGDATLYFIGDSQVANWDVEASFPNRITKNLGKNGAKIGYLKSVKIYDNDATVIIELGTNDLGEYYDADASDKYFTEYSKAIESIVGKRILLIEVLPTDDIDKNRNIVMFNALLEKKYKGNDKIKVVKVYDTMSRDGLIREDLTREGLHLNDYGYRILTDKIQKAL